MLCSNGFIIANTKMIKIRRLFFALSLLCLVLASCGTKKTCHYDRFGGGINSGKQIVSIDNRVEISSLATKDKKQNQYFQSVETCAAAKEFAGSEPAGRCLQCLDKSRFMREGFKVVLKANANINPGTNIAKLKKAVQDVFKDGGDKSKNWARILANFALLLLLLGVLSLILFTSESDFTGVGLLVLFWFLALVLLITALVLSITGQRKTKKSRAR